MITLWPLRFSKRTMAHAPREALLYHLMIAQTALEINILRKQATVTGNVDAHDSIDGVAGVAMTQLNIRLLAGRLVEARNLLEKPRFKAVRAEIEPLMALAGVEARKSFLGLTASKSTLIQKIRHQSAFHQDDTAAADALDCIDDDFEFVDYICGERGNVAMLSGFNLSSVHFARLANDEDLGQGTQIALDGVSDAACLFEDYVENWIISFACRYAPSAIEHMKQNPIELEGFPRLSAFILPYFLDHEDLIGLKKDSPEVC